MTRSDTAPRADSATGPAAGRSRPAIQDLREELSRMSAAERRLRSRDHQPGELTFAQLRSIAALGREREMTVSQLARSAELTPATVTVMLDHLEEANIVQRHRSTEDRRVCNVSLTPQGWELLERKQSFWHGRWEERLAEVSDEDLATAARVIGLITDLYESVLPPEPNSSPDAA